jgi:serine phosphatase RsbU (regulator of sigma subunit)
MAALPDRGLSWLRNMGRDVSDARRTLARSRGYTATALLALTLGMTASASVFSLIDLVSLRGLPGGTELRDTLPHALWGLMGATLLLVLWTAWTIAGLLVARGTAGTRVWTIRTAAARRRVTHRLLIETVLIAAGAAGLGLVTAPLVSPLLLSLVGYSGARPDQRAVLLALVVCVVTGSLFGLAALVQIRRMSARERRPVLAGRVPRRTALVVGQMACMATLPIGTGLVVRWAAGLHGTVSAASQVVMLDVDPQAIGHTDAEARRVMRDLQQKLERVPGVERVAIANVSLLTDGSVNRGLTIEADRRLVTNRHVRELRVSPGFFATLGTRIVAGRDFDTRDARSADDAAAYRTVIVDQTFAQRYFGDLSPVGRRIGIGTRSDTATTIEIIGLIEDLNYRGQRLTETEAIYLPFWGAGSENGTFYVALRGEPTAAFDSLDAAVAAVDRTLPMPALTTFDDRWVPLTNGRVAAAPASGVGGLALVMSAIGLYGMMAFVATQRTRQIGAHLALRAARSTAIWLVLRDTVTMVLAGVTIAVLVGRTLGQIVGGQLFGLGPIPVLTIAAATGTLTTIAFAVRDLSVTRERQVVPLQTLIGDLTNLMQRAASFPDALRAALAALGDRIGAQFLLLLEKRSRDEYGHESLSLPAHSILVNRLAHYPHPLPLSPEHYESWLRWARECRSTHVGEIERLRDSDARMAIALRTARDIGAVLLAGPPRHHRAFTAEERQVFAGAAEVLALIIENGRLNERALEQEQLRRDLALAAEVQRRLLPRGAPACAAATLAAFTLPARTVGGDYYDFLDLGGDRIGIAVADVSGKGIAAALLMSVVQASLRMIAAEPAIALTALAARLNHFLYQSTEANHYATFFYAQLDAPRGRLRYVNAGHNPPYLVRRNDTDVEISDLSVGGMVLGLFSDAEYEEAEVEVRPGDLFVAFTDGVTEARDAAGEEFGEERLKHVLRRALGGSSEDVAATLGYEMRRWIAGAEQHDDLTFVVAALLDAPRPWSTP